MQTMTEWKHGRDGARQKLIVFTEKKACLKTGPAGSAKQQSHSFFFCLSTYWSFNIQDKMGRCVLIKKMQS